MALLSTAEANPIEPLPAVTQGYAHRRQGLVVLDELLDHPILIDVEDKGGQKHPTLDLVISEAFAYGEISLIIIMSDGVGPIQFYHDQGIHGSIPFYPDLGPGSYRLRTGTAPSLRRRLHGL